MDLVLQECNNLIKKQYIYTINNNHLLLLYCNHKTTIMNIPFIDYTKTILNKVSFNAELFKKELKKAFKNLQKNEWVELTAWVFERFENKKHLQPCLIEVKNNRLR